MMMKFKITQDYDLYDEDGNFFDTLEAGTIVEGYLDCDLLLAQIDYGDDDEDAAPTIIHPGYFEKVLFTSEELNQLHAKEMSAPQIWQAKKDGAQYVGSLMGSYGDYNYYCLADGSYAYEYFSIGD